MLADPRVRRVLIGTLALIVAIFCTIKTHEYLTTGKLVVTTNQKTGSIRLLNQNNQQIKSVTKTDTLTARLKPGTYTVSAFTSSAYTNKFITVKVRQKVSVGLGLSLAHNPEPVINNPASSVSVGNDALYYLNSSTNSLMKIDAQGNVSGIDNFQTFKKIRWTSPGVGVAIDKSSGLYVVNNGMVNSLLLPFPINNNPSVDFSVAPDGNVYLSNGQDVYAGTLAGNFKKIYSSGDNYNSGLAASNDAVAFVEKNPSSGARAVVVVGNGRPKKVLSGANQLAWSPDGNYLAASDGKAAGTVYNGSLAVAYLIPNFGINSMVWINNDSMVYAVGNIVWRYNIANQQSKAIATLSANQSIKDAAISSDQGYLYFSGNTQLLRLAMKEQPSNSNLSALGAFLPGSAGVCLLNYVNFIKPIITIKYPNLEVDPALCVKAAKSQLQYYGLNPDLFQYVTMPVI